MTPANKSVASCQISSNEDFTALMNQIACIPRDSYYLRKLGIVFEVCLADKETFSRCTAEASIKRIVKTRNQALNLELSARHLDLKLYSDRKVQVETVNDSVISKLIDFALRRPCKRPARTVSISTGSGQGSIG